MLPPRVLELCRGAETVSSLLARDPSLAPGEAVKQLYGSRSSRASSSKASSRHDSPKPGSHPSRNHNHGQSQLQQDQQQQDQQDQQQQQHDINSSSNDDDADADDDATLQAALQCGSWGPTKPSALFLRAFAAAVRTLDADPLNGMLSPPLMGSHGTVPLTIIAPLVDIMRHCANLIARAEHEVLFITCVWSPSVAQRLIRGALLELSRRALLRDPSGRRRVVVKIMYGQVAVRNALDPHQRLGPEAYTQKPLLLPSPEEVPGVQMEVVGLHRMLLGTLHSKFCVVDRRVAALMSNNVEDNANMEMLAQVEGPVVDSVYDTALVTWSLGLNPPLPSHAAPAATGGLPTASREPLYVERGEGLQPSEVASEGHAAAELPEHTPEDPHYDADLAGEILRMQSCYSTKSRETRLQAANRQLNLAIKEPIPPTGPDIPDGQEMTPYISTATDHPVPMAMVSRPPYGFVDFKSVRVPQNEAWLSLIRHAQTSIFIQTPDLNAAPLLPALADALRRGVEVTYYVCFGYNDVGEVIPFQGGTNEQAAMALLGMLPEDGPERQRLRIYDYVGKDQDRPIHQSLRARCCHIKLLIADGTVGVQGSGNQDTQSWFHSQEVNVMVDSEEVCRKWRECVDRNQNTRAFGRVAGDGVWRDAEGKPAEGYMGNPGPVEGLFKGVTGMMKKLKAAGG